MKTVYLEKPGKLIVKDVKLRELKEGEILLKVKSALTCGTTLKSYLRGHPKIKMPGPFGHECSGVVESLGKNLKNFKRGDRIVCLHTGFCGKCDYCLSGKTNLCKFFDEYINLGAYSEKIIIPEHIVENFTFKIPQNISFKRASLLQSLSCVMHGINLVRPQKNERILIIGTGGFGVLFAFVLKYFKHCYVILGRNEDKCKALQKKGLKATADEKDLLKHFKGKSPHIVIEAVGNLKTWEKSISLVEHGGKVLFFGGLKMHSKPQLDYHKIHYSELKVFGAFNYTKKDVLKAKALLFNDFVPDFLISGKFPLAHLEKAFKSMQKGQGYKYEIIP